MKSLCCIILVDYSSIKIYIYKKNIGVHFSKGYYLSEVYNVWGFDWGFFHQKNPCCNADRLPVYFELPNGVVLNIGQDHIL